MWQTALFVHMKLGIYKSLILKILLIGITFFLFRSCLSIKHDVVASNNGHITLSWDTEKTEKLFIKGELLFYWKQWPLTNDNTFDKHQLIKPDTLKMTDAVWTAKGYPPKGFGTYRFLIEQKDLKNEAILNFSRILGACEVWINGEKLVTHGNFSKNPDNAVDGIPALIVELPKAEFLDVMFLVSSSNSRLGGGLPLQNSIDAKERFYLLQKRKFAFESLTTFLILFFGMYQIFIYYKSRPEKYFLYFGLFCLFGGTRQLFVGEVFAYKLFPEISFEIVQRLRYICFYGGLAFMFLYHHYLFPSYFSRKVILFFTLFPALGILYVAFTSVFYGTYSAPIFHVFGFLNVITGFWLMLKAMKDKKPYAQRMFLNLIILSATFTNDILNAMMLKQTEFIVNIGVLTYVVFQVYLNYRVVKAAQLELQKMTERVQNKEAEISKLLYESYHHLKSKRELINDLKKTTYDDTVSVEKIISNLRSELLEDNQLNVIKSDIEQLNYDFVQRLKARVPKLTPTDLELCTYIHIGLNRKEIARLRHVTIEAVKKSRYRLRKKLDLSADKDLENFLKDI